MLKHMHTQAHMHAYAHAHTHACLNTHTGTQRDIEAVAYSRPLLCADYPLFVLPRALNCTFHASCHDCSDGAVCNAMTAVMELCVMP